MELQWPADDSIIHHYDCTLTDEVRWCEHWDREEWEFLDCSYWTEQNFCFDIFLSNRKTFQHLYICSPSFLC